MSNNVRLGIEAVLVIVLIIALFLYFSQQQQLTDAATDLSNAQSTAVALGSANEELTSSVEGLEQELADAQTAAEVEVNAAATAVADAEAAAEEQAAAVSEAMAQVADAEAAVEEQASIASTAMAQVAAAEEVAAAAASAQADAETAASEAMAQAESLQATIDAMNAATPEPVATEAEATEVEATEVETTEVVGFSNDLFSMALDDTYTTYSLIGDDRDASITTITGTDAGLATRIGRESAHEYAAVQGAGEYILVNQQALPAGVASVADVAGVAFRRADSSEIVTLGENEVGRGSFGANEVRYILIDGGSMWIITFDSADVAANVAAYDAFVATFDAVEAAAEE